MAGPAEFAHLHVASSFSLRYGTATPRALAARAASLGMSALALTDRDGLYGAFKHVQACADAGIKPLLGADLGLRADDATWQHQRGSHGPAGQAQGDAARGRPPGLGLAVPPGLRRPRVSRSRQADDVPAVTRDLIAEHAAGLVMLLGPASDVGRAVAARRPDLARRALDRWRQQRGHRHRGRRSPGPQVDVPRRPAGRARPRQQDPGRAYQRGPLPGPGRQPDRPGARRRAAPRPARLAPAGHAQRPRLPRQPGRHDRHRQARRRRDDRAGHGKRRHPAARRDR